jgi:hypothetical protein
VLNIGNFSGAHVGFDDDGNEYLTDSTGATRIYLSPSAQYMAFYTAGTAALLMTLAGTASVDPFTGQSYPLGITVYGSNGSYINLLDENGYASMLIGSGSADESYPSSVNEVIETFGATDVLQFSILGPTLIPSLPQDYAWLGIQSAGLNNTGNALGNLSYVDTGGNNHTSLEWGVNGVRAFGYSDGNTYDITRLTTILETAFTINSTSPQAILSVPVGIGTYEIDVWLVVNNTTAADSAAFQFQGPAVTGAQLMDFVSMSSGTATVGYGASATYTTAFDGLGLTGNQRISMRATLTFTAAGTFEVTGAELVSGHTVNVSAGSKLVLRPVTA